MTDSLGQHPWCDRANLVRSWALIALLFCASAFAAEPAAFAPDTKVAMFSSRTEEWVRVPFAQVKPGSEFTHDGRLYRSDNAGRAAIVPGIDTGKIKRADRPYDNSSYRGPRSTDAVRILDADLRVTSHALLGKVAPRTRLCFQSRVYYLEANRNLAYRGILTTAKRVRSTADGGSEGYSLRKTLVRSQPIEITQGALRHVMDRHAPGGARNAGKSTFFAAGSIRSLISDAIYYMPVQQSGDNMQRVIDAGRPIGIYRATGKPTNIYTVITTPSGMLVTAFPGPP